MRRDLLFSKRIVLYYITILFVQVKHKTKKKNSTNRIRKTWQRVCFFMRTTHGFRCRSEGYEILIRV